MVGPAASVTIAPARTSNTDRRPLEFIEVASSTEPAENGDAVEPLGAAPLPINEPGWNLWGDADR